MIPTAQATALWAGNAAIVASIFNVDESLVRPFYRHVDTLVAPGEDPIDEGPWAFVALWERLGITYPVPAGMRDPVAVLRPDSGWGDKLPTEG